MSKRVYQRTIPTLIVSGLALVIIFEYFGATYDPLAALKGQIVRWGNIISVIVILFSFTTLLLRNARVVTRQQRGRPLFRAVIMLASFIGFGVFALSFSETTSNTTFLTIYNNTAGAVSIAMAMQWCHAGFLSFRLFRLTSLETIVMFAGFFLNMLKEAPAITSLFPPLLDTGIWVMSVPHVAAQRASFIALAVGTVILGVRAILTKEPGLIEVEVGE